MIAEPHPSSITFTFLLDGNSVCGQEHRPDRCEDCSEMSNCVLDCFYDALSKGDGCDNPANTADTVLNEVLEIINRADVTYRWNKDFKRIKELREQIKEREP